MKTLTSPPSTGTGPIQPGPSEPQKESAPKTTSGPPSRTPQQVQDEAVQRFQKVDEKVLKGGKLPPLDSKKFDSSIQKGSDPGKGRVSIRIGLGGNEQLAIMPTKGVPGKDKAASIQKLVSEGEELFQKIMTGKKPPPAHGKIQLAKLMWYLQALGSAKAALSSGQDPAANPVLFKEGAFSVEDPERRLEDYLRNTNSYKRSSSHLKEFQGIANCTPRGVDVRGVCTPNARKTVLFARMPGKDDVQGTSGAPHMEKNFLFLKMEPHGCRGVSTRGTGRALSGSGVGKSANRFFANIKDWFGHLGGFLKSSGQRSGATAIVGQNNRERIPKDVKKLYKKLMKQSSKLLGGDISALGKDKPLSSTGGIRTMIRNLENALAQTKGNERLDNPDKLINNKTIRQNLVDTLALLRAHGDHPEHRIGNEVILTSAELTPGMPTTLAPPSGKKQDETSSSNVQTSSTPGETPPQPVSPGTTTSTTPPPTSTTSGTTPPQPVSPGTTTSTTPPTTSTTTTGGTDATSGTPGTKYTPGVNSAVLQQGGTMPGTPVTFSATMGPGMTQKWHTCFIVSVLRGLVEKGPGRDHLHDRVNMDANGNYHVRLTHGGSDHVVTIPAASLNMYKGGDTVRPDAIHALECALVNFMQENRIDNYAYGNVGDATYVAELLGLVSDISAANINDNTQFTAALTARREDPSTIMALVSPEDNNVLSKYIAGKHFVAISGSTSTGDLVLLDSTHPSTYNSLPVAELRQVLVDSEVLTLNSDNKPVRLNPQWQFLTFTIPAAQQE